MYGSYVLFLVCLIIFLKAFKHYNVAILDTRFPLKVCYHSHWFLLLIVVAVAVVCLVTYLI